MRNSALSCIVMILLGACVYSEGPEGRFAAMDLPVQSQTTIQKTVTVNAPPGTTVVLQETTPPVVIERSQPSRMHCYVKTDGYTNRQHRVCY